MSPVIKFVVFVRVVGNCGYRRHFQDVYDLCWSMNENHLISGSIDCCAILWNLKNPNKVIILKDHKQFVQVN